MKQNENTQVMGYCDSDWVGNAIDRKSTSIVLSLEEIWSHGKV